MEFVTQCLYCNKENHKDVYACDCINEPWFNQYRVLEVHLKGEDVKPVLQDSFNCYQLQNARGALQYAGIPNSQCMDNTIEMVGNTEFFQLPVLSRQFNANIFLKNEGNNPSGCFKDRETLSCYLNSKCSGLDKAVIYSSGNAAASAALFAQHSDFHLITFVPGDTYPEKIQYILDHGADVIVVGDGETNFEEGYRLYSELVAKRYFMDAGYDDWAVRNPFRVEGDKTTAVEIVKQFRLIENNQGIPDFVIIPTANGSCLAGMWKGFKELHKAGIIESLPRMVSVGMNHGNPIYKAVKNSVYDRPVIRSLEKVDSADAKMGSIILAEEGYDSIEAAKAVRDSKGYAFEVHVVEIEEFYNKIIEEEEKITREHHLLPEPASVISLAAIPKLLDECEDQENLNIVSVITGHGMKARSRVKELLHDDEKMEDVVDPNIKWKEDKNPVTPGKKGKRKRVSADSGTLKRAFDTLKDSL